MDIRTFGWTQTFRKWNKTLLKGLFLTIGVILFIGCFSYTHPNGKKEKSIRFAGDRYKERDNSEFVELAHFDLSNYQKILDTTGQTVLRIEEVGDSEIRTMVRESGKAFILLWYPDCGSILPPLLDLMYELEEKNTLPIIMVSMTYDLERILINQAYFHYLNQTYVLDRSYGKQILVKKNNLTLDLCPDCFERLGMSYTDVGGLIINQRGEVEFEMIFDWNAEQKKNEIRDRDTLIDRLLIDEN